MRFTRRFYVGTILFLAAGVLTAVSGIFRWAQFWKATYPLPINTTVRVEHEYQFITDGHVTQQISEPWYQEKVYDETGLLIREEYYRYDNSAVPELYYTIENQYNAERQQTKTVTCNIYSGEHFVQSESFYENGFIVKKIDHRNSTVFTWTYDEKGREILYKVDGKFARSTTETTYSGLNSIAYLINYQAHEDGYELAITEETVTTPFCTVITTERLDDEDNKRLDLKIIEKTTYLPFTGIPIVRTSERWEWDIGEETYHTSEHYNALGNEKLFIRFDTDGNIQSMYAILPRWLYFWFEIDPLLILHQSQDG